MAFIIDTNVLIICNRDMYPISISPYFWAKLKQHIIDGDVILCEQVCTEIENGNDDLSKWITENKSSFPLIKFEGSDVINALTSVSNYVMNNFNVANALKFLEGADAFIIAYAIAKNYTVVTYEEFISDISSKKVKIPNICVHFNVPFIFKAVDMIKQLNFSF